MSFSLWSRRLYSTLPPRSIASMARSAVPVPSNQVSLSLRLGRPSCSSHTKIASPSSSSSSSSWIVNRSSLRSMQVGTRVFTTNVTRSYPTKASQMYHSQLFATIPPSFIRKATLLPSSSVLPSLSYYSTGPSRFPQVNRPSSNRSGNRWAQGVGLIGAASLVLGKTKYLLAALKMTKLASLGSMVLSIGAYSLIFGLPYAIGIVGLILCHECGHMAVMLQRGLPFSPMVFIPFMGAVIATKNQPRDAWEDALIAAGGPVAGTLASGAVAVAAHVTDAQVLYALADFGYMINLFNLLPIGSMDGGRWVGALSKYVGVVGTGIGGYLAWYGMISNPIIYLIWLLGAYETFQKFYDPHHLPPNFYRISTGQRALLTGGYFGLIAVLFTAMAANQRHRKSPEMILREQGREPYWDSSSFE